MRHTCHIRKYFYIQCGARYLCATVRRCLVEHTRSTPEDKTPALMSAQTFMTPPREFERPSGECPYPRVSDLKGSSDGTLCDVSTSWPSPQRQEPEQMFSFDDLQWAYSTDLRSQMRRQREIMESEQYFAFLVQKRQEEQLRKAAQVNVTQSWSG